MCCVLCMCSVVCSVLCRRRSIGSESGCPKTVILPYLFFSPLLSLSLSHPLCTLYYILYTLQSSSLFSLTFISSTSSSSSSQLHRLPGSDTTGPVHFRTTLKLSSLPPLPPSIPLSQPLSHYNHACHHGSLQRSHPSHPLRWQALYPK